MKNATKNHEDLGHDFQILTNNVSRLNGGTWVSGRLDGFFFDALVFEDHAESEEYELGTSRISKLAVKRIGKNAKWLFNFDRGLDVPAANANVQAVVDFLCEGLAATVFGF